MSKYRAVIRTFVEVEFDDDGSTELRSQASDAFVLTDINPSSCDYEVVEVVPASKETDHD